MIKAIAFDIGGVLISESSSEARKEIAEKYGFSPEDFSKIFMKYLDYSYTGWHYNSFFKKLVEELDLKVSYQELVNEWLRVREETSIIDEDLKNLIERLGENYIIGILSNSTFLNEKVTARKNVLKLFDENFIFFSHELGFRKPEKEIYEIMIEKFSEINISPEEIIFVDDFKENLTIATSLGLKTILFENVNQLKKELDKLGVKF